MRKADCTAERYHQVSPGRACRSMGKTTQEPFKAVYHAVPLDCNFVGDAGNLWFAMLVVLVMLRTKATVLLCGMRLTGGPLPLGKGEGVLWWENGGKSGRI